MGECILLTCQVPRIRPNTPSNQVTRKGHVHRRSSATASRNRRRVEHKLPREQPAIPTSMVGAWVKLGRERCARQGEVQRSVHGSFHPNGRFYYWLGFDTKKPERIAQKDVEYDRPFKGMTRQQILAKVIRVLKANLEGADEV